MQLKNNRKSSLKIQCNHFCIIWWRICSTINISFGHNFFTCSNSFTRKEKCSIKALVLFVVLTHHSFSHLCGYFDTYSIRHNSHSSLVSWDISQWLNTSCLIMRYDALQLCLFSLLATFKDLSSYCYILYGGRKDDYIFLRMNALHKNYPDASVR